jgi:MHS family proline/betaine transporter-like MFS transporter
MPNYLSLFLSVPLRDAQNINTIMLTFYVGFSLLAGYLADKVGSRRLLLLHISAILLLSYPLFRSLQGASYNGLVLIHLVFAWLLSGVVAVMMETLGSSLTNTTRAFGMSVIHTLAATFFGGTAPTICTYLTHKTGMNLFPAFYMIAFAGVALGVLWYLPHYSNDMKLPAESI